MWHNWKHPLTAIFTGEISEYNIMTEQKNVLYVPCINVGKRSGLGHYWLNVKVPFPAQYHDNVSPMLPVITVTQAVHSREYISQ